MKQTVLNLLQAAGVFAPFRVLNRDRLLIVMYHRFGEEGDGFSTTASAFDRQLRYLKQHYNVMPLSTVALHLARGVEILSRTAVITIDDGYRDAYSMAAPLLRKYQLPATVFVVTDFVDRKSWLWTDKLRVLTLETDAKLVELEIAGKVLRFELDGRKSRLEAAAQANSLLKQLPDNEKEVAIKLCSSSLGVTIPEIPTEEFEAATWDELREMEGLGIEIGSHTVSHPILTKIEAGRVRRELRDSKVRLENVLGHEVSLFCYPNGISSDLIKSEVSLAGYKCAVSATPGLNNRRADLFALRRVPAEHDFPHFVQGISGFEELKNSLRSLQN